MMTNIFSSVHVHRLACGGLSLGLGLALTGLAAAQQDKAPPQRPSPPRLRAVGPDGQTVTTRALETTLTVEARPNWVPDGYELAYEQSFQSSEALRDFVMTDPQAWKVSPVKDTKDELALELATQSKYAPSVRSPVNIALVADRVFTDFMLEVSLRQTGREYGHRDMCLFYAVQDPSHFYYTHIATKADDHAHNIFIVKEAPRTKIATKTTEGVNWGLEVWHRVRLERKGSDGTIKVYFDDMTTPIMEANDKNFTSGYIGFGSFDDTGMVDNIRVWAPSVARKKTEFFQRPTGN